MNFGIKINEILHPEKIEFAFEFDGREATGGELRGRYSISMTRRNSGNN